MMKTISPSTKTVRIAKGTPDSSTDRKIVQIDVSRPPSTNRIWRGKTTRNGRFVIYKSPSYQAWLREFWGEWALQKPHGFQTIKGPFKATLLIQQGKRHADLGNYEKAMLDAAQATAIISNDRNARETLLKFVGESEAPKGARLILEEINDT